MPTDTERIAALEADKATYKAKINELVEALGDTRRALQALLPAMQLKDGIGGVRGDLGKPVKPLE